jgi:3-hydroxyisobutyrate dehydrogenase-like beta-hydroxyacid dehydrogenase
MNPVVAIIAPGQMGSAVAARLVQNGLTVWTVLQGRGAQSAKRAEAVGMIAVAPEDICKADIILSIVPPGEAESLASQYASLLSASAKKPIYADCNAVNPRTAERIAAIIKRTDCSFVDAGIIGGPPRDNGYSPVFYLSGEKASAVAALNAFGLECRVLDGPIGAASALKMSYAGITKGLTALASMMILAATREGMGAALHKELAGSQPALLAWFERQIPSMFGKAYRWVAEMEEIAEFVGDDPAAQALFQSTARLYERLAADAAVKNRETQALAQFFRDSSG